MFKRFPNPADPQDGTLKPPCKVEDHKWNISIDGGSMRLECLDAHPEEECEEMDGMPGCLVVSEPEWLMADFGPLKLKWKSESHGWEYPRDFDSWLEVEEEPNKAELALLAGLPMFPNLEDMIKDGINEEEMLRFVRWMETVFQKGLNQPEGSGG